MDATQDGGGPAMVERLRQATNRHDLEALVACFAPDYRNETPVHPERGFSGREQVRKNWQQIFAAIPDVTSDRAQLGGRRRHGLERVGAPWDATGRHASPDARRGHLRRRRRPRRLGALLSRAGPGGGRRRRRRGGPPPGQGRRPLVILVAGGTGRLGTLVVRRLADRGLDVRVLTRDPTRAEHLAGGSRHRGHRRRARPREPQRCGRRSRRSPCRPCTASPDPRANSPTTVDRDGNANLVDAAESRRRPTSC